MASASGAKGSTFKWEGLKPMPTKRVFSSAVEVEGQLFVIGGCDQVGKPIDAFESISANMKKWNRLAPLPTPRAAPCCVVPRRHPRDPGPRRFARAHRGASRPNR